MLPLPTKTEADAADTVTLLSCTQASTLFGGQGDDVIDGSASSAPNFISGDAGNDTIMSGAGFETVLGGQGVDVVSAANAYPPVRPRPDR